MLRIPNTVDLHCHFGPDTIGGSAETGTRGISGAEAAREAREAGQAAIVLKSHSFPSTALAKNLEELTPGIQILGGICTDNMVGGLNLQAVETALAQGAKVVWLPTVHSRQDFLHHAIGERPGMIGEGIYLINDDGDLIDEVHEIASLVREHEAVLATGHTTAEEHYQVARELAATTQVVATHAGEVLAGPRLSPQQCRELATLGMTIELAALSCKNGRGVPTRSPREIRSIIELVGAENCILSTDYGWSALEPRPAQGHREFIEALWQAGVEESSLVTMASTNPARLVGIDV